MAFVDCLFFFFTGILATVWIFFAEFTILVEKETCVLVQKFGVHSRILHEGYHILFPLERVKKFTWKYTTKEDSFKREEKSVISLKETTVEFDEMEVKTKDNLHGTLFTIMIGRIVDPKVAAYKTEDLVSTLESLALLCVQDVLPKYSFIEISESRDEINKLLNKMFAEMIEGYGYELKSFCMAVFDLDAKSMDLFNKMEENANAEKIEKKKAEIWIEAQLIANNTQLLQIEEFGKMGFTKDQISVMVSSIDSFANRIGQRMPTPRINKDQMSDYSFLKKSTPCKLSKC